VSQLDDVNSPRPAAAELFAGVNAKIRALAEEAGVPPGVFSVVCTALFLRFGGTVPWPRPGDALALGPVVLATLILIASSATLNESLDALRRDATRRDQPHAHGARCADATKIENRRDCGERKRARHRVT
jgi:hypothetical protein